VRVRFFYPQVWPNRLVPGLKVVLIKSPFIRGGNTNVVGPSQFELDFQQVFGPFFGTF